MAVSSVHTGWGFRQNGGRQGNTDHSAYYAGTEVLRLSASAVTQTAGTFAINAGGITVNESGADSDSRIEGDNNANLAVFDAGQDAISLGGANVDGAALTLNNLTSRTAVTAVGHQFHVPAQTTNFDNGSGTVAVGAAAFIGIPTYNRRHGYADLHQSRGPLRRGRAGGLHQRHGHDFMGSIPRRQ